MGTKRPKRRNAWLITWESPRQDYLENLRRPIVVAILKPQLSDATIERVLPILFASESRLTFTEKIGHAFFKQHPRWLYSYRQSIFCGDKPYLHARLVKNLYVERHKDSDWHQTLHWTERAKYELESDATRTVKVKDEEERSEEVHFDELCYGESREP